MADQVAVEDIVLYRGEEEWSALYVRGKLAEVGDHYWVEEKLHQLLGIDEINSDDFLRGGNSREDVAQTLEEIEAYRIRREETSAEAEAEGLLQQAAELIRRAREVREQAGR